MTSPSHPPEHRAEVRLQKILAQAGFGSRRSCEQLIQAGRVEVNGSIVTQLGTRVDPDTAEIRCDGRPVRVQRKMTYMVHKPSGVICTNQDEPMEGRLRKRVVDLIPKSRERLYTIGRLDMDSEGLILVTNDGELCQYLTHPRYEVSKTYHVVVHGALTPRVMEALRSGVWLADPRSPRGARKTSPARVLVKKSFRDGAVLEVSIREGLNREIRRIFARMGLEARHLKRIRIGTLALGSLPYGEYRLLTPDEISSLFSRPKRYNQKPFHSPPPAL